MTDFQKPHSYNVAAAHADIPPSLLPSVAPRPLTTSVKQVVVQSTAGSQQSGGRIEFLLPANNYVKSGSMYLSMTVTPQSATGTPDLWNFSGPCGSAASLINRLNLQISGLNVERLDYYWLIHNMLLAHASSYGYYASDSVVTERPYGSPVNDSNVTSDTSIDVAIPLMSQVFNNGHEFPLFLVPSGATVMSLDLNNYTEAFCQQQSAARAITNYTLSNIRLIYDVVEVGQEFQHEMRKQLEGGKNYSIPFVCFRAQVQANASTNTFNFGINCSSLKAVFWFSRATKTLASAITGAHFDGPSVGALLSDGQNNNTTGYARLFLDSTLQNSIYLNTVSQSFAELRKALGKENDTSISSASDMTRANWSTAFYVGALSTRGVDDEGYSMTGKPVAIVQLEVNKPSVTAGAAYCFLCFDSILVLDHNGQANILQ